MCPGLSHSFCRALAVSMQPRSDMRQPREFKRVLHIRPYVQYQHNLLLKIESLRTSLRKAGNFPAAAYRAAVFVRPLNEYFRRAHMPSSHFHTRNIVRLMSCVREHSADLTTNTNTRRSSSVIERTPEPPNLLRDLRTGVYKLVARNHKQIRFSS